jgi:hypothetical protein
MDALFNQTWLMRTHHEPWCDTTGFSNVTLSMNF